jgi:hypothetical protein
VGVIASDEPGHGFDVSLRLSKWWHPAIAIHGSRSGVVARQRQLHIAIVPIEEFG